MANLSEGELQSVNSWLEAVRNSKGYEDKFLVLDLIRKFETDLVSRLAKNPFGNQSLRHDQLLSMINKIQPRGGYIDSRLWWWKRLHGRLDQTRISKYQS